MDIYKPNTKSNIDNKSTKTKNECDSCQHACTIYSYECTVCPFNYEYNGTKKQYRAIK